MLNRAMMLAVVGLVVVIGARAGHANLVTNPSNDGTMDGWTIMENGGSGWHPHTTLPWFCTSNYWDTRYQIIDLVASGYSASFLYTAPEILVSERVSAKDYGDYYYIVAKLLDETMNEISQWNVGTRTSPAEIGDPAVINNTVEETLSHVFSGYGAGVRYVRFEDGGKDSEGWSEWYGARFTDATVSVSAVPEPLTMLGMFLGLGGVGAYIRRRRMR